MRLAWIAGAGLVLWAGWAWSAWSAPRSVTDVVRALGPAARARLQPHFERGRVPYPPAHAFPAP